LSALQLRGFLFSLVGECAIRRGIDPLQIALVCKD
jgi:hypothetical protein